MWVPYVTIVVPSALAILVWLVFPAFGEWQPPVWVLVPVWVAGYLLQRTVLRALFVRRGLG